MGCKQFGQLRLITNDKVVLHSCHCMRADEYKQLTVLVDNLESGVKKAFIGAVIKLHVSPQNQYVLGTISDHLFFGTFGIRLDIRKMQKPNLEL